MEPVRSCPICPQCGSKKFEVLKSEPMTVKCLSCSKIIQI